MNQNSFIALALSKHVMRRALKVALLVGTMLAFINPEAVQTSQVSLFTKPGCPHCARAKALLEQHGLTYEELTLGDAISISAMRAIANADTVPQVFIDGQHIGGADDLTD